MVTFGSLVAAGMTLLTALLGVLAGMAGLFLVTAFVDVSSTAPVLALMLGLAVGIDYALFISSRHRTQLARGLDPEESVGRADGDRRIGGVVRRRDGGDRAGRVGVVGVPFLTAMGLAAAATVLTAVLVALTLLPAHARVRRRTGSAPQASARRRPAAAVKEGFGFRGAGS